MENTLQRLGKRIREIRIQRGFASQEALADYLNMHRTFIGHLETGRKDFRLTTLIRVAEALEVPLSALFTDVEGDNVPVVKRHTRKAGPNSTALKQELAVLERVIQKMKKLM